MLVPFTHKLCLLLRYRQVAIIILMVRQNIWVSAELPFRLSQVYTQTIINFKLLTFVILIYDLLGVASVSVSLLHVEVIVLSKTLRGWL